MKKLLFVAIFSGLLFVTCKDKEDGYPADIAEIQEKIVGNWGTAEMSHWFTKDGVYYFICPACGTINVGTVRYSIIKNGDRYYIRMTAPGYSKPREHEILEITNTELSINWEYINGAGEREVLHRVRN